MGFLTAAFPQISNTDFEFIQSFRKEHDRYYEVLPPHFTLVFPAYDINEDQFTQHVTEKAAGYGPIEFTLRCAVSAADYFSEYRYIFLLPDEGASRIIKLHDKLYTGVMITRLRIDIPYFPHMTIGNEIDPYYAINLTNELNVKDIAIKGVINELTIGSFDDMNYKKISSIKL